MLVDQGCINVTPKDNYRYMHEFQTLKHHYGEIMQCNISKLHTPNVLLLSCGWRW